MNVRNDSYTVYRGILCRLYQINARFRLQTNFNSELIKIGFLRYENKELEDKMFKDVDESEIESAFYVSTYCTINNDKYYLENIINNKVILAPDDETKKKLGIHIYDDRRIEMKYAEFMSTVSEIWEERQPFANFKFTTEGKVFIKNSNF
jgi:hypothetical protein